MQFSLAGAPAPAPPGWMARGRPHAAPSWPPHPEDDDESLPALHPHPDPEALLGAAGLTSATLVQTAPPADPPTLGLPPVTAPADPASVTATRAEVPERSGETVLKTVSTVLGQAVTCAGTVDDALNRTVTDIKKGGFTVTTDTEATDARTATLQKGGEAVTVRASETLGLTVVAVARDLSTPGAAPGTTDSAPKTPAETSAPAPEPAAPDTGRPESGGPPAGASPTTPKPALILGSVARPGSSGAGRVPAHDVRLRLAGAP